VENPTIVQIAYPQYHPGGCGADCGYQPSRVVKEPTMARVFLSYSTRDAIFARRLASDLGRLGHTIWPIAKR